MGGGKRTTANEGIISYSNVTCVSQDKDLRYTDIIHTQLGYLTGWAKYFVLTRNAPYSLLVLEICSVALIVYKLLKIA